MRAAYMVSPLSNLMAVILTWRAACFKWGFFPVYPHQLGAKEREEQWSTFLLEIKPNCPFSLVVP